MKERLERVLIFLRTIPTRIQYLYRNENPMRNLLRYLPSVCIFLFIVLFVYSATLYPGGSQADLHSTGFDWVNNYWCNLMGRSAMNGKINEAQPFAIVAMVILCIGMTRFFFLFADQLATTPAWRRIIEINGGISMVLAALIFTVMHDTLTIISSFFGFFALLGVTMGIAKSGWRAFQWTGLLCLILLGANNFIYYSEIALVALPLLQKITFLVVLGWVVGLNFKLAKFESDPAQN